MLSQRCNTIYPTQQREELWKGLKASVSNSISQPVEVVQPEGRNSDLHTFTYPQLRTPHHPWDGVTTGVHLEAKRPFPTGPSGPHCAFVPQWDPLPLQSPANHFLLRQSHLCRPRVNFVWTRCERTPRGLPHCSLLHFLFYFSRKVRVSRGLKCICAKYQHSTVSLLCAHGPHDLSCQFKHIFLTCNLHLLPVAQY